MDKMTAVTAPVRVSIPASVAADLGTYKKAVGRIMEHLGCPACCSGHDIFFELQRDVVFAKDLRAVAYAGPAAKLKETVFERARTPAVSVGIKPELAGSIESVFDAMDRIAEITGHPACATGCDMFFNLEERLVLTNDLQLEEQVLAVG